MLPAPSDEIFLDHVDELAGLYFVRRDLAVRAYGKYDIVPFVGLNEKAVRVRTDAFDFRDAELVYRFVVAETVYFILGDVVRFVCCEHIVILFYQF